MKISRCITAVLATILCILSSGISFGQEQVKAISWWYELADPNQQKSMLAGIITPYNQKHPQYRLTIDYRGNEIDKQMRVALLSGSAPDIVYTSGPSYVAPMARAGQLLALDDYATRFDWNTRIQKLFLEMGKYDGKLYALPKTYETLGIFYNQQVFAKYGWKEPKSIEELETLADAMLAKKIVPFATGNGNWRPANEHYVSMVLNAIAGPENVHKALRNELPWTAEPFVKAIDTINYWWQKGYFGPNYFSLSDEQQFAQMAKGEAGMMLSGTWQFQRITTYFTDNYDDCVFIGFPSASDVGDKPIFPLGVGSTFSIAAKAKNKDGAASAINYIFSEDVYEAMVTLWPGEWNLPLNDLSTIEAQNALPRYLKTMKQLAAAVSDGDYGYTTWTFLPPATNERLYNGIEEVWLGRTTTSEYLKQINTAFQKEWAAGKVPAVPER